jgi:hypothetical protein
MTSEYCKENANIFICKSCDFICSKKSNYETHLSTLKHKNASFYCKNNAEQFECICGNIYKHRQSLYNHKKKCQKSQKNATEEKALEPNVTELLLKLLQENMEIQKQLIMQSKEPTIINNNNTTNNHFNLNVYLNETCKDAINLKEFVDGLEVKLKDLEYTAKQGYSEGVSRIFIKGLNELEVNKRPIHCSDLKRETLYIKDENMWHKEDANRSHLTSAIKSISKKNMMQIFEWQKKYPNYNDPSSRENDKYQNMIYNAMSGISSEEQENNMTKIIRNVIKETVIEKS